MNTSISPGTLWITITVVAVASYCLRLSFLLLFGRINEVPEAVNAPLRYVAPAVLAALVLPKLLVVDGTVVLPNARLVAGAIAAVIAWRTGNITVTVGVGMVALWTVDWLT